MSADRHVRCSSILLPEHIADNERQNARLYLGEDCDKDIAWALISEAYTSVAETAIVSLQDILGLGSDAG